MQSTERQFAYLGPPSSASQHAQKNSWPTKLNKLPKCGVQITGYPCAMCLWNILSDHAGNQVSNSFLLNLRCTQLGMEYLNMVIQGTWSDV